MTAATQSVGQYLYQVYVNNVLYRDIPPADVELSQQWGKHDIFRVRIVYPRLYPNPNSITKWPENAAVKVIWGRKPDNINTWYGYVNHYEDENLDDNGLGAYQTTYYLIGTSKPMNSDVSKNWGSVTPTYIAKSIATKYSLRSVLTKTTWQLPNETQANESDFCFMNRLAEKTGYRFWVSGGTLYFIDPAVILLSNKNMNAIPVFRQDKTFYQHDTMRRFSLQSGDNLPGSAITQRNLYGMTPYGQIINPVADGSTGISNVRSSRFVQNYAEGKQIVNAWHGLTQFWREATAEFYGSVFVYPGKLVQLAGQWLPGNTSGFWIISGAKHKLKSAYTPDTSHDWYVTEVTMHSNTKATMPSLKGMSTVRPEFTDCKLIDGKWHSSAIPAIYDGEQL